MTGVNPVRIGYLRKIDCLVPNRVHCTKSHGPWGSKCDEFSAHTSMVGKSTHESYLICDIKANGMSIFQAFGKLLGGINVAASNCDGDSRLAEQLGAFSNEQLLGTDAVGVPT